VGVAQALAQIYSMVSSSKRTGVHTHTCRIIFTYLITQLVIKNNGTLKIVKYEYSNIIWPSYELTTSDKQHTFKYLNDTREMKINILYKYLENTRLLSLSF